MINKNVGKIVRVEWNKETNGVQLVLEITDDDFKSHVLHNKEFEDILSIIGKDVMIIASKHKVE